MGVFKDTKDQFERGLSGNDVYERADVTIKCSHCGNTHFKFDQRQLHTKGLTFMGLDWANATANVYICKNCGHLEWFIED